MSNLLQKKPITIVLVSDNHYIILLAALVKSIEETIRKDQPINIYLIDDNISGENKQKLLNSINPNITTIYFKEMANVIPEGITLPFDRSSYPLNIYLRLFIPYFIPQEIEKVLYLDVDMIVQKDISTLFDLNISDYPIAAVLDPRIITFDNSWGGILNYKELNLPAKAKYFNTGLLLIDLHKWRDLNLTEKIIDCINANKKFANYPDQYGLNIVLANMWFELDSLWNHFSSIETKASPYLIHFVEKKPIYSSYKSNKVFKKKFYYYLNQTAWKNHKPINEFIRLLKKVKNIQTKYFR